MVVCRVKSIILNLKCQTVNKFCVTTIPNQYCHYHISLFYSTKVLLLTTVLLNYLLFPAKYILETVFVAYHKCPLNKEIRDCRQRGNMIIKTVLGHPVESQLHVGVPLWNINWQYYWKPHHL